MFKVIIIGLVVTIAGLFVMSKIDPNNPKPTNNNNTTITGDEVKVVITGQVMHPGEYLMLPNETLGELIDKAGGCLSEADPNSYTSGLLIGNRTEFYIPARSKTPETCIVENIIKYNLNSSGVDELKKAGFNSAQAAAIIEYRTSNGPFAALEEIKEVTGIGEKTYLAVRDYLILK